MTADSRPHIADCVAFHLDLANHWQPDVDFAFIVERRFSHHARKLHVDAAKAIHSTAELHADILPGNIESLVQAFFRTITAEEIGTRLLGFSLGQAAAVRCAFGDLIHDLLLLRFSKRRHIDIGKYKLCFPLAGLHGHERVIIHFGSALLAVDHAIAVLVCPVVGTRNKRNTDKQSSSCDPEPCHAGQSPTRFPSILPVILTAPIGVPSVL